VDGNKRSGAVPARLFLELIGIELHAPTGSIYGLTLGVASGQTDELQLAEFFRPHAV
jgi:prophage maintenance system killer protein